MQIKTGLRILTTVVSSLILGMFIIYHYFTNSASFSRARGLLELAIDKETELLIKELNLRETCEKEERPLKLFLWPGNVSGCACAIMEHR